MVTSSDDDDAPLLSEGLRRNVVPRVAGSASVADFGQTVEDSIVSRESTQFPLISDGGLVEVAPGIVDATAVALPPPDVVESLELDLRVPAFDPVDSDDEYDAFPRDGASAVPVGTVVEPDGSALHSEALTTAVDDDDCGTAHDSPSLVVVEPSQQFGRFTVLAEPTKPRSRRLVLVSSTQVDVPTTVPDSVDVVHVNLTDGDVGALSDTESNRTFPADGWDDDPAEEDDRMSEADVCFIGGAEESEEDDVPFRLPGVATLRGAFASLDDVNLVEEFDERACVMKSVPRFMNGHYRIAMRVALEEMNTTDEVRVERGWKLFLLLPRMLLHRASRGGLIPRPKLMNRLDLFNRGVWRLLEAGRKCSHQAAVSRRRKNRRPEQDIVRRVSRAESLVHMGELSSARQALEGASLAPGSEATLNALRDPEKRPQFPRHPLPREMVYPEPEVEFDLDELRFARNLRPPNFKAS